MSVLEIRERLRPVLPGKAPDPVEDAVQVGLEPQRAFLLSGAERTLITGPVSTFEDPTELPPELASLWEKAAHRNPGFLYLQGRFVEAERANRNGAFWTADDLSAGQQTVAGGPLNWLHEDTKVIGALADAQMIRPEREAAKEGIGPHIAAFAHVWRFLYPREAAALQEASEGRKLWYSMECVSEAVECRTDADTGREGCGRTFPYKDVLAKERVCAHLQAGTSARRFIDPIFLGGAVILPPVRPGWANAHIEVVRQAASLTEDTLGNVQGLALSTTEAELMVAQVLQYAGAA